MRGHSIRINQLLTTRDEIEKIFRASGISCEEVVWYEAALTNIAATASELMDLPQYKEGKFYIQNLSSMIPALMLNPHPEDRVLDLCAAPGSKTTQIAEMMQNRGEIIANDVSRERIFKLKANLSRHGITNVQTTNIPGEAFARKESEAFDKTLVDVPCSMGQEYATKNLKRLIQRQKNLLRSGYGALKCGGILVYSTCSPRFEENEGVIEWFKKRYPEAIVDTPLLPGMPEEWQDDSMIRIENSDEMEHFFVARIKKVCVDEA